MGVTDLTTLGSFAAFRSFFLLQLTEFALRTTAARLAGTCADVAGIAIIASSPFSSLCFADSSPGLSAQAAGSVSSCCFLLHGWLLLLLRRLGRLRGGTHIVVLLRLRLRFRLLLLFQFRLGFRLGGRKLGRVFLGGHRGQLGLRVRVVFATLENAFVISTNGLRLVLGSVDRSRRRLAFAGRGATAACKHAPGLEVLLVDGGASQGSCGGPRGDKAPSHRYVEMGEDTMRTICRQSQG